ncbi:SCP-like protein [Ancylostoma caninum]|uniref:SCP-like protein n=1 Tax=Ancylostoma caninum TaxID=29170 RepID=A0A368GFH2_ANCCA|nr:SCP-like protein [Ancylostoma caninum]
MLSKVVILFLCVGNSLAKGISCDGGTLTRAVRLEIIKQHRLQSHILKWDCELEKKAASAFDKLDDGEVDTDKIKIDSRHVNDYTYLSHGDMKTDVEGALYYWSKKQDLKSYENMIDPKNQNIGCAYKFVEPMGHLVCIYV